MVNHPWQYHLNTSPHSPYMILQTRTFYHEITSIGVILFLLIYFLYTPLHGLAFYSFNYLLCLFPSYLNHAFVYFNRISTTIYLMYLHTLKNLHAKITTYAYYRTHFTQQSKAFHNSKPGLLFFLKSQSKWMY